LTLPETTRQDLLAGARAAVAAASALVRERSLAGFATWQKADRSFVTEVDLAVERLLRDDLSRRFLGHDILGEELDRLDRGSDFQWIIDPIDGTLSFTRGIPLYGIIVGLFHEGKPLLGVIDHPALGITYSAARGLGTWRNERRIVLQDLAPELAVEDEPIAMGDRHQFMRSGLEAVFDRLVTSHPRVRTYADCFGHTLAVQGSVGAMVDFGLKIWDLSATQVLVEEAGGEFRSIERADGPEGGRYHHMVCGKPRVVAWALEQIAAAGVSFSG
jgi:fructose-1,6-bisphosphatase/inositol monophosphatase family enzyme